MQAILVGAGCLVAVLMVSDFLRRVCEYGQALPPFVDFIIFCGGMAATQAWQVQNRPTDA